MSAVNKTFLFIGIVLIAFLSSTLYSVMNNPHDTSPFIKELLDGKNESLSILLGDYEATGYYEEDKAEGTVFAEVLVGEVAFFATFKNKEVETIDYAINCSSQKATNEEISNKCYLQQVYPENTLSIQ